MEQLGGPLNHRQA